jgi:transcriptional regulator GlxA family with amidase domain
VFTVSADAVEMPSAEAAFLAEAKATIEARLADADFGPYELADALAMSPRQLRRKLGSLIDETPNKLIRRFRLERAADLLAQGVGSVQEVATAVGFGSTSRFSAAFREHHGVAPSKFPAEVGVG